MSRTKEEKTNNLLQEATVRRFMRLAQIDNVGSKFIEEAYGSMPGAREDEDEPAPEEEAAGMSLEGEDAMSEEGGMSPRLFCSSLYDWVWTWTWKTIWTWKMIWTWKARWT